MFIVYNVIHKWKRGLGYSLLAKIKLWIKTKQLIINLTHNNLITAAKEIKETNMYINLGILAFE